MTLLPLSQSSGCDNQCVMLRNHNSTYASCYKLKAYDHYKKKKKKKEEEDRFINKLNLTE